MVRFWIVRRDHNRDLYLTKDWAAKHRRWVRDELEADRFGSEYSALEVIRALLNGKGHAVEVVAHRSDLVQ